MTLGGGRSFEQQTPDVEKVRDFFNPATQALGDAVRALSPAAADAIDEKESTARNQVSNILANSVTHQIIRAGLTKDQRIDLDEAIDHLWDLKRGTPPQPSDEIFEEFHDLAKELRDTHSALLSSGEALRKLESSDLGVRFKATFALHTSLYNALIAFSRRVFGAELTGLGIGVPGVDQGKFDETMRALRLSENEITDFYNAFGMVNTDFADARKVYDKQEMEAFFEWIHDDHVNVGDFGKSIKDITAMTEKAAQSLSGTQSRWRSFFTRGGK